MADFNRALELDPRSAATYFNRGNAWFAGGDADKALADFEQAIKINPNVAPVWNNAGNARFIKGDIDGAIASYNRAIELDARYALAYANRGMAKLLQWRDAEADRDFEQFRSLNPNQDPSFEKRIEEAKRLRAELDQPKMKKI